MADETKKAGGREWIVPVAISLSPVLYFLSIGPMGLAHEHGLVPKRLIIIFYAPLNWLAERSDTFATFGEWYCRLWGLGP